MLVARTAVMCPTSRRALTEPVFTAWRAIQTGPGTAARVHDLREIVNATLYVNRMASRGSTCRTNSHRTRPSTTTTRGRPTASRSWSTTWLHHKTRGFHGRREEPTAAVVDEQSVKTSAKHLGADRRQKAPDR